ncbi:hypothetical protein CAPTEDRAFT_155099 [Capitella teleta]|uniref:Transcription elongation factor n=1 Tax=Capitella teleta TaxID=283909 RepID=X1Z7A6_CAPTE|nr:hypothetical protein CAPTEDRAFT_155099 [Capitella teleta]|eukprot:ELU04705.1 hypothetical protein CAPTEDRAFT_155099 [Capitella teleta]
MPLEEDVVRIKKKLEKMMSKETTDAAVALDMLNQLRKLPMNLQVLTKTKIGVTVNQFRKSVKEDEVVNLAKSIIKGWKKFLSNDNNKGSSSSLNPSAQEEDSNSKDSMPASEPPTPAESSTPPDLSSDAAPRLRRMSSSAEVDDTSDPVRIKCRELLTKALQTPPEKEGCAPACELAAGIEQSIYNEFKNTEMKYKTRVRSRVANLRDSKNPKLREGVMYGFIPPERMASMTSEEMASDDLKKLREKFTKEAINDHQMAQQGGTETDFFKCGRCGKRRCQYNQVQTRSADEPMTTFVLCVSCGNRWKFC